MKILELVCLFSFLSISTMAQVTAPMDILQEDALKTMRGFRNSLNKDAKNPARDSLLEQTDLLISFAKTLKDTSQLTGLDNYFTMAANNYNQGDQIQKMEVIENLNQDINFKINASSTGSDLNLSPNAMIFVDVEVKVAVKVNGQAPRANHTLFWTYFTGINQDALIKAKSKAGNSVAFSNPYKLTIRLPGYITFWLLDTNTQEVFKCVPDYLQMVPNNKSIDMNFIPINL